MPDPHAAHGIGNAERLLEVKTFRAPGLYGAEAARSGADIPQDHECGGPGVPALAHVRTPRFFTDRMKVLVFHQTPELREILSGTFTFSHAGRGACDCSSTGVS